MRGKLGLIAGLAAGYVLGTRAGRERYEQISAAWSKLLQTAPVQKQLDKAKSFAKTSAMAIPGALWGAAVKVGKAATTKGTAGEKLDAAVAEAKDQAPAVGKAIDKTADAVADAAEDIVEKATTATKKATSTAAKKTTSASKTAAKKTTPKKA